MPARGISTCRDAPCGHLPPGIFPRHHTLLHLPPLRPSSPGRVPSPWRDPPCGHLPPGILPRHHTLLHLPPLRASSPGHLPTPSYPLAPAPLARIFPRAPCHAIIPSYFCATFTMILW